MKHNNLSPSTLRKTFVMQHDQTDCGVACLLSLIRYYGGDCTLEKLRELSGTNTEGTSLLGLYQAAGQTGFTAEGCEADAAALIEHGQPVILHITPEKHLNHYIVCYGYDDNRFVVGDPAQGIVHYTSDELERIWLSHACLTLTPSAAFVKAQIQRRDKWRWFVSLLRDDRQLLLFSIVIGAGIAVLSMAMAVFSQRLIDDILPSHNVGKLTAGIVLLGILLIARVGLDAIRQLLLIRQTRDFNNRITDRFYSALLSLPKRFFDTRRTGELVARLNDTQRVQRVVTAVASSVVIDVLTMVASFIFLFYYSWQTGLIVLAALPVYFILIRLFNHRIIHAQRSVMQSYALSESNYVTTMQGIAAIKNHNRIPFFGQLNRIIYGHYQEQVVRLGKINVRLSVLSGIFGVLFLTGILAYTSSLVLDNQLKLGELMAVLGIAGSLLPAVAGMALITISINEAHVAFNRMYEFASLPPEEQGKVTETEFHSLEVEELTFRFPGQKQLFRGLSLTVNIGECIVITGESGCGESTFVQLLQKFYPYESGRITLNKHTELSQLTTDSWRRIIGVVPQQIELFNGSVVDNLLPAPNDQPEAISQFATDYGFLPFIESLPQGFATLVGEEGINLSGGQQQLIGFMRALYHKPQLLILDEFTSAMDIHTEQFVLNLLQRLKPQIAILFVSHRLHTIRHIADRIFIIDQGIVTHSGTHEELLSTNNFYSNFWGQLT